MRKSALAAASGGDGSVPSTPSAQLLRSPSPGRSAAAGAGGATSGSALRMSVETLAAAAPMVDANTTQQSLLESLDTSSLAQKVVLQVR
jgi:hypothetical protein